MRTFRPPRAILFTVVLASAAAPIVAPWAWAQDAAPAWLYDRGTGVSTSQFGTYVRHRETLVYTFYEYTLNTDQEYKPSELGFMGDEDFQAKRTDHEALIFLAHAFTEDLEVELESALYATAMQHKAAGDRSAMPSELKESGLGDTEGQIRWRMVHETGKFPEVYSTFEVVLPLQKDRVLIGTQDWELAPGLGIIKGYRWGTVTARAELSYTSADQQLIFGQYGFEYLKRTSPP